MFRTNKRKVDADDNDETNSYNKRSHNGRVNRNDESIVSQECLKYMLKELALEKLVTAVDLDKRLMPIATEVYKGPVPAELCKFTNKHETEREGILEYFGDKILKLELEYEDDYHCFNGRIEKLIIDQCCKTLMHISLTNAGKFAMSAMNKPFEKVFVVNIRGHMFCNFMANFGEWFPAVESLDLRNLEFRGLSDENFPGLCPQLKRLYIRNLYSKNEDDSYVAKIADFVAMNKQLRFFLISQQHHTDKILSLLAEHAPEWPNLRLVINSNERVELQHAKFKRLNELGIGKLDSNIKISTDSVNKLKLNGKLITGHWLNLISMNQNALTICLMGKWENVDIFEKFIASTRSLSNLIEICLPYHEEMTALQLVDLLNGIETLKTVHVRESDLHENHTFVEKSFSIVPYECPSWKVVLLSRASTEICCQCAFDLIGLRFEKGD